MGELVFLAVLMGSALCQWPPTPALTPAGVPPPPWEGPIADHEIGKHPQDTPEVAREKAYHLQAHKEVLSVLPELPPEIRYQMTGLNTIPQQQTVIPQQPHIAPQQYMVPEINMNHLNYVHQVPHLIMNTLIPTDSLNQRWTGPIADHELGKPPSDTPEVAAAKNQHLVAHKQVASMLPVLPVEHRAKNLPIHHPGVPQQYIGQQVQQDTWDVEQAKLEHARKYAEALKLVG